MEQHPGRQRSSAAPIIAKGQAYPHAKSHGLFLYDSLIWIYFVVVSHKSLKRLISGSFFLLCGGICSENAVKDGLDEPCRNMIASWFFCFEYFRLVQHQKSIREHPEHQFNHDAWGAFSMFTAYQFLIGETGGGDQRLKSLVMPLSLAVSFFT